MEQRRREWLKSLEDLFDFKDHEQGCSMSKQNKEAFVEMSDMFGSELCRLVGISKEELEENLVCTEDVRVVAQEFYNLYFSGDITDAPQKFLDKYEIFQRLHELDLGVDNWDPGLEEWMLWVIVEDVAKKLAAIANEKYPFPPESDNVLHKTYQFGKVYLEALFCLLHMERG